MDLTSKKTIKKLLGKQGPSKRLGQNFLINRNVLSKIIDHSNISGDIVLEIGPGIGALTLELSKKAKKVVAVEKDPLMRRILEKTLSDVNNVDVLNKDILKMDLSEWKEYKVASNLPYYIVSPVIRKLLEESSPKEMFLMAQKEVAERIVSAPPNMSILSVSVQFYSEPQILFPVSRDSFWPRPKVDSCFLKITPRLKHKIDRDLFFKVVKLGFSHPRKQLVNNLSQELKKEKAREILLKSSIDLKARAETLSLEDWVKLATLF